MQATPPLDPADYGSLDAAMASAQTALPGRVPQFIGFPGGDWSARAHHYAVFFQGDRPLTQHLLTPALVDARNADADRCARHARDQPGADDVQAAAFRRLRRACRSS